MTDASKVDCNAFTQTAAAPVELKCAVPWQFSLQLSPFRNLQQRALEA